MNPVIELRNVKINLTFSEETTMFTAFVYVDGKKVAHAKNDGHGGCTYYHAISEKAVADLKRAEAYCQSLPPIEGQYDLGNGEIKKYTTDMDLEEFINQIIEKEVEKKDKASFNKKMQRDMLKCIVVADPDCANEYRVAFKFKIPISEFLNDHKGKTALQGYVQKTNAMLQGSEKIINTNIPAEIFSDAPISVDPKQESAAFKARVEKHMIDKIVIANPDTLGPISTLTLKVPVEFYLAREDRKPILQKIIKNVKMQLQAGQKILNTNIPAEMLK